MKDAPQLDARDLDRVLADLLERLPAYVPGWQPASTGPGQAILQIYARYLRALGERLSQAPEKHRLAFLQMLGLSLIPAQAARAPLVFEGFSGIADSRLPERARAGAKLPEQAEPLVFETERAIALASARLREVVSLWPGADGYADHSADHLAGRPFTLFKSLQPIPHALYLAHDELFALTGQCRVEIGFELEVCASEPLPWVWEYWDGAVWRGFQAFADEDLADQDQSFDGTLGLSRGGVVRLVSECAQAARRRVDTVEGYWLRARLDGPLTRGSGLALPQIRRVWARSLILKELWKASASDIESAHDQKLFVKGQVIHGDGSPASGVGLIFGPSGKSGFAELLEHALCLSTTDANGEFTWKEEVNNAGIAIQAPEGQHAYDVGIWGAIPAVVTTVQVRTKPVDLQIVLSDGAAVDAVLVDGQQVDPGSPFAVFGPRSEVGSACSIRCDELFGKPDAEFTLYTPPISVPDVKPDSKLAVLYWNGRRWADFPPDRPGIVPADLAPTSINGVQGFWSRLLLRSGGYYVESTGQPVPFTVTQLRLGYRWRTPKSPVQHCLTCNDFDWADRSAPARWGDAPFAPFAFSADVTPALYLGLDGPLPADSVGLYLDIEEGGDTASTALWTWEYWDGKTWTGLSTEDETKGLRLPGMVTALWPGVDWPAALDVLHAAGRRLQLLDPRRVPRFAPGDRVYVSHGDEGEVVTVASVEAGVVSLASDLANDWTQAQASLAGLARFGVPRTWLRARLPSDGDPIQTTFRGIHLNAVWGIQAQTFENELLGSGLGQAGQVLFARNTPVLAGEVLEVRELQGARAEIELPMLIEELARNGLDERAVRTVRDRRSGRVGEVWVRWQARPHLYFSGPDDRHYMIERAGGRLIFGDGAHGRLLPPGRDNVRLARYRSGGGASGNVATGAIGQQLSGGAVQSVTNPHAAEGGADGETIEPVRERGAAVLRHFQQAISATDYEALARQASPAVAYARALAATHPDGYPAPGWVTVVIVPRSQDPRPQPTFRLRQQVQRYLLVRAPAALAGKLAVIGPRWLPIGVEAVLISHDPADGGTVHAAVTERVLAFLHPLTGGPEGRGWPAGRDVFLSDLAAAVLRVPGLDRVVQLQLLTDGTPQGERVAVPDDRIVVAGPLRIRLRGDEV